MSFDLAAHGISTGAVMTVYVAVPRELPVPHARILGIDPGTRHIGWAMIDIAGELGAAYWVDGGGIDVCEPPSHTATDEWLSAARSTRARTQCTPAWIRQICTDSHVTCVALEEPTIARAAASRNMLAVMRLIGRIIGWCECYHIDYVTRTSHQWRAALTGDRLASDAMVRHHISVMLGDSLPKKTNPHIRDAAGLAWACGQPPKTNQGRVQ